MISEIEKVAAPTEMPLQLFFLCLADGVSLASGQNGKLKFMKPADQHIEALGGIQALLSQSAFSYFLFQLPPFKSFESELFCIGTNVRWDNILICPPLPIPQPQCHDDPILNKKPPGCISDKRVACAYLAIYHLHTRVGWVGGGGGSCF